MVQARQLTARAFRATCRGLVRFVPPDVLYFLLLPYSLIRGFAPAVRITEYPVTKLPRDPAQPAPRFLVRWRYQARFHQRWLALLWHERWLEPPWRERISVTGSDLLEVGQKSPLVIVTVHTGGMVLLTTWLRTTGLRVGAVMLDQERWERDRPLHDPRNPVFRVGDTRAMVRFLEPNSCLMLPADHSLGRFADGAWGDDAVLRLSIGAFRLAGLSGAVVVPVTIVDSGRWRYRVQLGAPVPQDLIDDEDFEAAATHVAREIMPIAAKRPFEAMGTLVEAVRRRGPSTP